MWEPQGCCCFTRKTGCLILGGLSLAGALLTLIAVLQKVTTIEQDADRICALREVKNNEDCLDLMPKIIVGCLAFMTCISVINLSLNSMLIHGVRKDIPCLMMPVMVYMVIHLALLILIAVGVAIILAYLSIGVMVFSLIIYGGVAFLYTYFLLVLRAYYLQLRHGSKEAHQVLVEAPFDKEYEAENFK